MWFHVAVNCLLSLLANSPNPGRVEPVKGKVSVEGFR